MFLGWSRWREAVGKFKGLESYIRGVPPFAKNAKGGPPGRLLELFLGTGFGGNQAREAVVVHELAVVISALLD